MPPVMNWQKILFRITLFALAMGYLESAVVMFLRELYYPEGFEFPLQQMNSEIIRIEILREAATIIMLITLGLIAGKTRPEKFAWFLYSFGIWDISYYAFLKIFLNWPESWFTWDVLFLIPTVWTSPVLCPVILSLTMIGLVLYVIITRAGGKAAAFSPLPLSILIAGSLVILVSLTFDYSSFILDRFSVTDLLKPGLQQSLKLYGGQYTPGLFPWWLFITGECIILSGIYFLYRQHHRSNR